MTCVMCIYCSHDATNFIHFLYYYLYCSRVFASGYPIQGFTANKLYSRKIIFTNSARADFYARCFCKFINSFQFFGFRNRRQ